MSKARKHQRTSLLKYHPIRYAQSRELFLPETTERFLSLFKDPIQGVFDKYQITFKKLGSILAKYFHHYLRNSVSSNLYGSIPILQKDRKKLKLFARDSRE